jgi:hypothetical protein
MKLTNMFRVLRARVTLLAVDESGMSTVEYAFDTAADALRTMTGLEACRKWSDIAADLGGRCRIRTCLGVSRRIYSPNPLFDTRASAAPSAQRAPSPIAATRLAVVDRRRGTRVRHRRGRRAPLCRGSDSPQSWSTSRTHRFDFRPLGRLAIDPAPLLARVETGGPSLTQGRSESSAQPLPDERLHAGRNQAFATLRVDPSRVPGRSSRGIRNASGSGDAPGGHRAPMLQTSGEWPPRQQRSPRSTSA